MPRALYRVPYRGLDRGSLPLKRLFRGAVAWAPQMGTMEEPAAFEAELVRHDGHVVVALRGELDMCTAPQLWETLAPLTQQVRGRLVLDLSGLTFMDSSGISCVIRAHKALRDHQGEIVLSGVRPVVHQTLELTGLTKILVVLAGAETEPDPLPASGGVDAPLLRQAVD